MKFAALATLAVAASAMKVEQMPADLDMIDDFDLAELQADDKIVFSGSALAAFGAKALASHVASQIVLNKI